MSGEDDLMNIDKCPDISQADTKITNFHEEQTGWNLLCEMQDDIYTDSSLRKERSDRNFSGRIIEDGYVKEEHYRENTGWNLLCEIQDVQSIEEIYDSS